MHFTSSSLRPHFSEIDYDKVSEGYTFRLLKLCIYGLLSWIVTPHTGTTQTSLSVSLRLNLSFQSKIYLTRERMLVYIFTTYFNVKITQHFAHIVYSCIRMILPAQ